MSIVQTYGNIIKKNCDSNPTTSRNLINLGLHLERLKVAHLSHSKNLPSFTYLNAMALGMVEKGMKNPQMTCWNNLFAPVEIMESFGINCLSMEVLSSFFSGFTIEDLLIDASDDEGLATTLCSFHRTFIGANNLNILIPPRASVTTSNVCDGNINTFRYVSKKKDMPLFLVDVPHRYSEESVKYVEDQLQELIVFLEDTYKIRYNEEKLQQILQRENESHQLYEKYLHLVGTKSMPSTLTLQMFTLFASHLSIGSEESLQFYRLLLSDVEKAPLYTGKKILWVHVLPFYDESLKKIFNHSSDFQIQAIEMNSDSNAPLDVSHPLNSVARKLVANVYNKGYEEKAALCARLAQQTKADGVIHFAHWGCKQTSGGVQILKKRLQEDNLPVLLLDGDAVDRRNEGKGQMKTRVEAFCELLAEGDRR